MTNRGEKMFFLSFGFTPPRCHRMNFVLCYLMSVMQLISLVDGATFATNEQQCNAPTSDYEIEDSDSSLYGTSGPEYACSGENENDDDKLTSLPINLFESTTTRIDLSYNRISNMSDSPFVGLSQLYELDLSFLNEGSPTSILANPYSFVGLTGLSRLLLRGNRFFWPFYTVQQYTHQLTDSAQEILNAYL